MGKKLEKTGSSYLLTGSLVAVILAVTPYFFYTYEILPDGKVWENFLFTYESNYYQRVIASGWTIYGKLFPFLLLTIWFLTCKHWWYHCILIPIAMYGYQLIQALNDDLLFMDKGEELAYIVPVVVASLSFTYLARTKVFDRIHGIDISEIENYVKKPSDKFFN